MKTFSAHALVVLLFAFGIEQGLALPTTDNSHESSIADADLTDGEPQLSRRAPGDSAGDPRIKAIDASETKVHGQQELWDADCFAHLCKKVPMIMNYWDGTSKNRQVAEGNGVKSKQPFKNSSNGRKYHVSSPDNFDKYISPEEWLPASSRQGGAEAIIFPVTQAAQTGQGGAMSSFWAGVPRQKGDGPTKGSWVRIKAFDGAQGPYCTALNDLLANYDKKFDTNGVLKGDPPAICTDAKIKLNGLAYDMGFYAYKLDAAKEGYDYVGKRVKGT